MQQLEIKRINVTFFTDCDLFQPRCSKRIARSLGLMRTTTLMVTRKRWTSGPGTAVQAVAWTQRTSTTTRAVAQTRTTVTELRLG